MILEILENIFQKKSESFRFKNKLWRLILYYIKLQYGQITGKIYFRWNQKNNSELNINPDKITDMLDQDIINFMKETDVKNIIDTKSDNGYEHLGYGCFATRIFEKPIIFSQGNATFFLKQQ